MLQPVTMRSRKKLKGFPKLWIGSSTPIKTVNWRFSFNSDCAPNHIITGFKSKTSTQVLNDEESSARNEQKESPGELVRSVENWNFTNFCPCAHLYYFWRKSITRCCHRKRRLAMPRKDKPRTEARCFFIPICIICFLCRFYGICDAYYEGI